MKKIILFFCCIFLLLTTKAQMDAKSVKKLNKAKALVANHKYENAEKIFNSILDKYPYYGTVWDAYADAALKKYQRAKYSEKSFSITVSGESDEKSDSLIQQLSALLSGAAASTIYYTQFTNVCRNATLKCEFPSMASAYLRAQYFDADVIVDKDIKDTANKIFAKAEKYFAQRNYTEAIKYYQKAIDLDSNFYFAKLYLGDCYYMLEDYVNAVPFFKIAVKGQPKLVEPRKYLVDALMHINADEEALEECIQALLIYPDVGMFSRLETIVNKKGKTFNKKWIPRELLPKSRPTELPKKIDANWQLYLNAKNNIDTGIYDRKTFLKKVPEKAGTAYFEVHCWEEMLKSAPKEAFKDAREMQAKGYLDCYVLFSLFHVDYKDQFIYLAKNDRARLRNYIDLLIEKL